VVATIVVAVDLAMSLTTASLLRISFFLNLSEIKAGKKDAVRKSSIGCYSIYHIVID
jgi:hypothetical protein